MYYECLQKYYENEEIEPLYQFFMYQTEKTWRKTLAKGIKYKRKKPYYYYDC